MDAIRRKVRIILLLLAGLYTGFALAIYGFYNLGYAIETSKTFGVELILAAAGVIILLASAGVMIFKKSLYEIDAK